MGSGSSAIGSASPNLNVRSARGEVSKSSVGLNSQTSASRDVMISYSHADKQQMNQLRDGLEKAGITVWVDVVGLDPGVDFLSKIGQAIIDCKMFISLLSSSTVKSKYCQDELALAYVSNKPIFPVAIEDAQDLFSIMDTGMKLQLVRYDWNMFTDPENFDKDLEKLIWKMKTQLQSNTGDETSQGKVKKKDSEMMNTFGANDFTFTEAEDSNTFWQNSFATSQSVSWDQFLEAYNMKHDKMIKALFEHAADQIWIIDVLRRELQDEDNNDIVTFQRYTKFCTRDGKEKAFWECVQDELVVSYTMREVFDMESTVRVEAIQNLGKFKSVAVLEALMDLLSDKDNNIRAVAAISLAHTGVSSPQVTKSLMQCLQANDRLVREAGCLALGHLKAAHAVSKLIHLWRNDMISSVREAAQVALEQIGGDEARKAMHMTRVLAEEIHMLTKE